jgi:thiol-disulfide isomerase/thioredoxin
MKLLISQIEFEELIGLQVSADGSTPPPFTVVYFTAGWCGACRRLDLDAIESAVQGVNWLKCDVDQNNYTAGYCDIYSIPTFLVVSNKKVGAKLSASSTQKVIDWVKEQYALHTQEKAGQ